MGGIAAAAERGRWLDTLAAAAMAASAARNGGARSRWNGTGLATPEWLCPLRTKHIREQYFLISRHINAALEQQLQRSRSPESLDSLERAHLALLVQQGCAAAS